MDITNYFNLQDFYFNELVGDVWIGIAIGLWLLVGFSIKKKFPVEVVLMLCMTWIGAVYSVYLGLEIIWVFLVLGVGVYTYYTLAKFIQK